MQIFMTRKKRGNYAGDELFTTVVVIVVIQSF